MPLPADPAAQIDRAQRLADLVNGFPERVPGALPALQELLDGAASGQVRAAAVRAVGYTGTDAGVRLLLGRGLEDDAVEVRRELATALGMVDPGSELAGQAADLLRGLSADVDDEVRGCACQSLAYTEDSSPHTVAALRARLDDADDDARCEALVALAKLGDRETLPVLQRRLETADPFEIFRLELQAAAQFADPALLPGLRRIETAWRAEETGADGADSADSAGEARDVDGRPDGAGDSGADDARDLDGADGADSGDPDDDAELWADLARAIAASSGGPGAAAGPTRAT